MTLFLQGNSQCSTPDNIISAPAVLHYTNSQMCISQEHLSSISISEVHYLHAQTKMPLEAIGRTDNQSEQQNV